MAENILKNIWNELSSKGKTDSDFDSWQTNLNENEDVQANVYNYLKDNDYTKSEFSEWKSNALVAKTNDSASANPSVESGKKDTGFKSENTLSDSPIEKNTWLENFLGEKEDAEDKLFGLVDFVSDTYRAVKSGISTGASVDESFDLFNKGSNMSDQEVEDLIIAGRRVENAGMSKEQLEASAKMAKLKEEGYTGMGAFMGAYWDNPSALTSMFVSSLSMMAASFIDSGEVRASSAAGSGAGATAGAGAGAGVGALFGGVGALPGAAIGAKLGAVSGAMSGITAAMETGLTTAQLLQESAEETGVEWGAMDDKQRIAYVRELTSDKERFNDITNKALARGLTIGSVDFAVNMATFGTGKLVFGAVSKSAASALTKPITGLAAGSVETVGSGFGEYLGQKAAGQEYNFEEIALEAFADKSATIVTAVKGMKKGNPSYSINGQKMNGKQMSDALKIMDDLSYVKADIKIDDSPAVQKIVDNRRQNISADQQVDSRINDVKDRTEAIKLTKEYDKLKGNREGNKTKLAQIQEKLTIISDKYTNSQIDATIDQRQKAVAEAVETKFEESFNKNVKALTDAQEEIGVEPVVFENDESFYSETSKELNITEEYLKENAVDGIFVGNGKVYINKAQAKRSINIATGNTGAISVASHEVLHPIFNALIGGAKTQGEFVKQFRTRMTGKQKTYVDAQLKERGYTKEVTGIELMNIFSDGIIKNEITYDQTFFEKLGDNIIRLFKGQGFDKLSFDNGKEVYNFLKEYNTSIKAGKLSDKAISTIKKAEVEKKTKVADAKLLQEEQFSKTLTPEQSAETSADIANIKKLAEENAALAKKYNKEPIKSPKQTRLEQKVLSSIKEIIDKVVTNRTKALYDPIADDAKRNVTRDSFKESMRSDIEAMVLNEYNGSQELEKFIVNRSYLRANDLAKRLGIESQEDGGIKSDVDSAKNITNTKDEQTIDRSGTVERGQATFDELDIVDDKLISEIESELDRELKTRAAKGTLSEMISVKRGREIYLISWLENYIDKTLFKKILKKWGAIGESKGKVVIPAGYIDFLNSKKAFDIVTKALPIKTIKKSYSNLFKIERLGRELTPEGNPIYKIPPINKKTFLTYFLDGKKNTILERQKQLAREIITPVTKELIAEYATEENISKLVARQSIAPETAVDIANKIVIDAQINDLESKIDRYKGETKGFDIIQFSKNNNLQGSDLRDKKGTYNIYAASRLDADSAAFLKFPARIKNFIYDLIDKGRLTGNAFGGVVYESLVLKTLKSAARNIPGLSIITKDKKGQQGSKGYDSTGGGDIDIVFTKKNGKKIKILLEIKKNAKVRFGQVTLGIEDGIVILRKNGDKLDPTTIPGGVSLVARAQEGSANLQKILDIVNKEEGTNIKSIPLKTSISKKTYEKAVNSKPYKDFIKLTEELDKSRVADHYNKKGVYYIQIGGKGLYFMGKDIHNLGVPELDASFRGTVRVKRGSVQQKGTVYMSLISEPKIVASTLKNSPYTLETKEGIEKVFNQPLLQLSRSLNEDFNDIVEGATNIDSKKRYSDAKGKVRGRNKGKFKFFIPPSADDFAGLVSRLLGKGKKGDANAAWFKEKLFNPFAKGIRDFESYKQQTTAMVKALKKRVKNIPKGLSKIGDTGFTNEAAVRVYLWAKAGVEIPGLSKTDQKELIDLVENSPGLLGFANELEQAFNGYPEPDNGWLAGTVTTDIINMVNTAKRAEFLQEWQDNVDVIFSKENLNKLRAAYGDNYVEAMEDMLYRMKSGRNRPSGANKLTNKFMNWINDSVGTIMFFNTRSALLQTLSIANFINWGDNNPAKAAAAFANQKQFWSDFAMLFNSDFLKQRRSGLKNDVNADDIASAAESATNKSKAVLSSILKMGFLPTQMADSFAIAMGGASFIRNRINKYKSEGLDTKAAEEQAFLDFQEVAEETQQSSRPDRISQQQASPLGRIILAFANTPMQYMRLTKKAFLDLKNNRGDPKSNISKIVYYTFIQNVIFSSLQSALFASLALGDDEEEMDKKELRIANSMMDTILRGLGIYGAIVSTGKNIVMEIDKQSKADRPDFTKAADKVLDLSPPLSSKIRKLQSAGRAFSYSKIRDRMVGYGLDNPAFYAGGQVVSALTNLPVDRAIKKADNIRVAMDNDTKLWQSIALMLGYSQWDLGLIETGPKKKGFGEVKEWKRKWKKSNWKK